MDLPDCPPGTEGYEDSVVQIPKKPDDLNCTKAEREFQEHLSSLKIKLEDGSIRCMVERRGRDISATNIILQKMAEEVDLHNKNPSELDNKYDKYRSVRCHIQDSIDAVKAPLLGVEYLIEHPPEKAHYEPSYICVLCTKQGHPRTIINHLTCYWHKYSYLSRHFKSAAELLTPYRSQAKYRNSVSIVMNRIAQRIEDTYGRMRPVNIDKDEYERDKDLIHQWLHKSHHFSEKPNRTFEEVIDVDLINTISNSSGEYKSLDSSTGEPDDAVSPSRPKRIRYRGPRRAGRKTNKKKDPSPPVVAAPTKPFSRGVKRAVSVESLSDISLDEPVSRGTCDQFEKRSRQDYRSRPPFDADVKKVSDGSRSRYTLKNVPNKDVEKQRAPNYQYKVKLAEETCAKLKDSAKTMLAYHEENPEKHPLYPEEWKKFWNRRYKEIQAEGKDASKHDFKPEWIDFWTSRMKELHDEELRVQLHELYRKMCLTPPKEIQPDAYGLVWEKPEPRRRSPELRRRSPHVQRRSPDSRSRGSDQRRRSPGGQRKSPELRARSPYSRRRSPVPRRRSPIPRRRTPDYARVKRSPERDRGHGPPHRPSSDRRRSPHPHPHRPRSRSPERRRSTARTHIKLDGTSRDRSPLSQREEALPFRNRSPAPASASNFEPFLQTVMISDDELKPDNGISPWNSDNESLSSLPSARSALRPRSRTTSEATSRGRERGGATAAQDLGPPENVVATLRLLVALEDYLGSLGPRIVDMLTEALTMEKERANSSEELLDRESAVVLMETAKEKLKGAVQAGLVGSNAAGAVRAAIVRVASTLHAGDQRAKKRAQMNSTVKKPAALPVAGVGEVDRAQIAQQMAAALIAQGKTDVSSEELAQLVDAVVGMAEAKKREAEKKAFVNPPVENLKSKPKSQLGPVDVTGTASALQMLQSAYDENEKKVEEVAAADAMDGLSDSDLETLLKNFNELSAEEQHSLIAYLKKLEAKSPQRVERLRQYVSTAAISEDQTDAATNVITVPDTVAILSDDDDDYTVDEVFKSATLKVKENQMRQEMEIVKKSLEESKPALAPEEPKHKSVPIVKMKNHLSSATDLLALVQASIQSIATVTDDVATDVVASSSQPRSYGDRPESQMTSEHKTHNAPAENPSQPLANLFSNQQGALLQTPTNILNVRNQNMDNNFLNNDSWNSRQIQDTRLMMQDNMPQMHQQPMSNYGPVMQGNRGPPMEGNRGGPIQGDRGRPMQGNRGPSLLGNRGPSLLGNRGPPMQGNRGPLIQDNCGPPMQDNRGPPMQDNRGPLMQDNRGSPNPRPPMQNNQGPLIQDNWGNSDNQGPPMKDDWSNSMEDKQGPPMQDNWGNSMQNNRGAQIQDNWGNSMQDKCGPPMQDNIPHVQDNRGPMRGPRFPNQQHSYAPNQTYSQGPRGNFINGGMQNNYNPQNNIRGRGGGRGQYGGVRGRGRGYY